MTQKLAKKRSLRGLYAASGLVLLAAAFPYFSDVSSGEKIAAKNPALNSVYSEPETGTGYDRGVDPLRSLVLDAASNQGKMLKIEKKLTLKRGDTLMETLIDANVPRRQAYFAIEALSDTFNPRKIRAGQKILITLEKPIFTGKTGYKLANILMPMDFGEEIYVNRVAEEEFTSGKTLIQTKSLKMYAEGTIEDSLYLAALAEGVPLGVVSEVIRLFSFDVDFQREIWSGDQFKVYYERRLTPDGQAENTGKVLAATLVLRGKPLTFYRFVDLSGKVDYYTAEGKSARKMLMKTPVDGARLSSRYGSRKHPILGYTRMHKGVDFAALSGTPIMAAGDGVIERASRWGSFGNYVRIKHNGTYKTAYAHLSGYAKGVRSGVRVKQGQIIGYVGATGGATGPHLHYEIFKDGGQINPLNLKMPKGDSLKSADLQILGQQIYGLDAETGLIRAFFTGKGSQVGENEVQAIGD